MILFVFPVFCLTWQHGRERVTGSLRLEPGGSYRHTQALKPAARTGDAFTWGPSVCKSNVWEAFPFYGPARCGWHLICPILLTSFRFRSKGRVTRLQDQGMVDHVHLDWITLSTYHPLGAVTPGSLTKIQSLTTGFLLWGTHVPKVEIWTFLKHPK